MSKNIIERISLAKEELKMVNPTAEPEVLIIGVRQMEDIYRCIAEMIGTEVTSFSHKSMIEFFKGSKFLGLWVIYIDLYDCLVVTDIRSEYNVGT